MDIAGIKYQDGLAVQIRRRGRLGGFLGIFYDKYWRTWSAYSKQSSMKKYHVMSLLDGHKEMDGSQRNGWGTNKWLRTKIWVCRM